MSNSGLEMQSSSVRIGCAGCKNPEIAARMEQSFNDERLTAHQMNFQMNRDLSGFQR